MLRTTGPLRILDFGCGTQSPALTRRAFPGCQYDGADVEDISRVLEAQRAFDRFYRVSTSDTCAGIPDNYYDVVIVHHVLEHIPDGMRTLAALAGKVRPRGVIWVAFPSARSLSLPSAEGTLNFRDDPTHVWLPDPLEVSNLLLAKGFRIAHAGYTTDRIRWLIGACLLPLRFCQRALRGRMSASGLWIVLKFETSILAERSA